MKIKFLLILILPFFLFNTVKAEEPITWNTLEWQTTAPADPFYFTYENAQIYCQYLEEDGETISEEAQGYWRLPEYNEMIYHNTINLYTDTYYYWTNTISFYDASKTYFVDTPYGNGNSDYTTATYRVLCVHDITNTCPEEILLTNPDYYDWLIMNGAGFFIILLIIISPAIKSFFPKHYIQ